MRWVAVIALVLGLIGTASADCSHSVLGFDQTSRLSLIKPKHAKCDWDLDVRALIDQLDLGVAWLSYTGTQTWSGPQVFNSSIVFNGNVRFPTGAALGSCIKGDANGVFSWGSCGSLSAVGSVIDNGITLWNGNTGTSVKGSGCTIVGSRISCPQTTSGGCVYFPEAIANGAQFVQ